ncbi:hypothetical protein EVAR_39882_1 [Eumeta japonica]|uniref:Uncharacterized protein n=1 Tax=Eumeta variegata TaxID=151549 RepID=A0A4C1WQS8_EUMVA|nr:hypothetical protein EVAR_39882_1 [Eumeta japonica]
MKHNYTTWTKLITEWYPRESNRSKGRQTKRWEDDLKKVAGPLWLRTAKQRNEWKALDSSETCSALAISLSACGTPTCDGFDRRVMDLMRTWTASAVQARAATAPTLS